MTIRASDIRFRASNVMADVPEGGGGPSGVFIPDGASNAIFPDVTEAARAGGQVSIRQLFKSVVTNDTDSFQDANIIVSQPPNDANVSITLAKCAMFHQRTDIANAIENYLIQGPEWSGYLLENHVAGQRDIQIFQRVGLPAPAIGRTLVLIYDEGLPTERRQYVRVTRTETETRWFTYSSGGGFVDYQADVVKCSISDALRTSFPGSPPDRAYSRATDRTVIRDTTVADAANYYGAAPLSAVAALGDQSVKVASVYSQLVPSARTETVALDQRPAAQRSITLAELPRRVTVGAAPHTLRIKIGQENRGFSYTAMLKPLPEPGTVAISFMALGSWYTVTDDGAGNFTGSGSGTLVPTTGSLAVTFPSMPDAGSSVVIQWGERVGYTDRSSQGASVRPPEYAWQIDDAGAGVPGSYTFTWYSGGVLRTATDNGTGGITGHATGTVDYPSNTAVLRPAFMPDAGADINVDYTLDTQVTEVLTPGSPDAGGYIPFALSQQPQAGSLALSWVTVRNVSNTSGANVAETNAIKAGDVQYTVVTVPESYEPPASPGPTGSPGAPGVSWGVLMAKGP